MKPYALYILAISVVWLTIVIKTTQLKLNKPTGLTDSNTESAITPKTQVGKHILWLAWVILWLALLYSYWLPLPTILSVFILVLLFLTSGFSFFRAIFEGKPR